MRREEQGRTSNAGERGGGVAVSTAHAVAVGSELPESVAVIDIGVRDRSLVLLLVDEAEVVGPWGVVLQRDGEKGSVQLGLDGIKEGCLRLGLNCNFNKGVVLGGNGKLRIPVFIELKARPRRPSLLRFCTNCSLICLADSTAWPRAVMLPTATVSL